MYGTCISNAIGIGSQRQRYFNSCLIRCTNSSTVMVFHYIFVRFNVAQQRVRNAPSIRGPKGNFSRIFSCIPVRPTNISSVMISFFFLIPVRPISGTWVVGRTGINEYFYDFFTINIMNSTNCDIICLGFVFYMG